MLVIVSVIHIIICFTIASMLRVIGSVIHNGRYVFSIIASMLSNSMFHNRCYGSNRPCDS